MTHLVMKNSARNFEEIFAYIHLLQQYSELPISGDNLMPTER